MSSQLRLSLLGKPYFERNGQPLPGLTSVKGQALLAYLAVIRQPRSRTALAGYALRGQSTKAEALRQEAYIIMTGISGPPEQWRRGPLLAEGEFTLVKQYLQAALTRPSLELSYSSQTSDFFLYVMLVDAAAQQQDLPALQKYAPLAAELALHHEHTLYQATIHRAQGVAHRLSREYPEAETKLNQALEGFQKLATRWQIGRTLSELAELALTRNDKARALAYFSQALAAFEEMGAVPDAARTRARLASF